MQAPHWRLKSIYKIMRKPRVLMLGWEFPPEISGGLGIANYNLCKALSPLTDLTVILPKADPDLKIPNVEIIDLSRVKLETHFDKDELKEFEKIVKEKKIEFNIYPYPRNTEVIRDKRTIIIAYI